MIKQDLKQKIIQAIDDLEEQIIKTGDFLYKNPELGYKECKGTDYVARVLEEAGYGVEKNIAVTGVKAKIPEKRQGPTIAVLGELDAIVCKEHPDAQDKTGAVHACGHHIQTAVMTGVALAFQKTAALKYLGGNVVFMAVPSEEFVEMEFRTGLKEKGLVSYFGGKQEMVTRGLFDDIDISMMMHSLNLPKGKKVITAPTGNGFIGKKIKFIGQESHAGSAPEEGVNALNAAMLAINNIHAQRETFLDQDRVRVHPIITKGGDVVNVVPADVRMECYVRARTIEGLDNANSKVDRAIKAGAMAVGAGVEIEDMPGYLPLLNEPALDILLQDNVASLCGEDVIEQGIDFTGSFDFGDISHLMPCLHPFIGGVQGSLHSKNFGVKDVQTAFLMPVKALAMTIIDLLWDDAKNADKIISNFKPVMDKDHYLKWLKKTEKKEFIPCSKLP
jgi:amidohydrolase